VEINVYGVCKVLLDADANTSSRFLALLFCIVLLVIVLCCMLEFHLVLVC
jgi:hypothetical protein